MTDCKKCLFYDPTYDEQRRGGLDVVRIGEETPDDHFCFTFEPIPEGYFDGRKDCPKFLKDERG